MCFRRPYLFQRSASRRQPVAHDPISNGIFAITILVVNLYFSLSINIKNSSFDAILDIATCGYEVLIFPQCKDTFVQSFSEARLFSIIVQSSVPRLINRGTKVVLTAGPKALGGDGKILLAFTSYLT